MDKAQIKVGDLVILTSSGVKCEVKAFNQEANGRMMVGISYLGGNAWVTPNMIKPVDTPYFRCNGDFTVN